MYEFLGKFYDRLMYDNEYEKWTKYFLEEIKKDRTDKIVGLELGSGTGNVTIPLKKAGLDIVGLDISTTMLQKAYEKAQKERLSIKFLEGTCEEFEYKQNLDFVIAPIDTYSYIDKKAMERSFECVYSHLKIGGIFLFDVKSQFELEENIASNVFFEDSKDLFYNWENILFDDHVEMNLTFFEREEKLYRKYVENQIFYIHNKENIYQLLKKAGFKNIEVFGNHSREELKKESKKFCFICKKL